MAAPADPAAPEIEAALARVASSRLFASSERLRSFLTYIVRQSLDGTAESIKEFTIGIEVYKRRPDYDPKTDAIVRVECGRLRARLLEYYTGEGASDPVRI